MTQALVDAPEIRRLTIADAAVLLSVTESAGWQHELGDWTTVLRSGIAFGHWTAGGEIVSSAAVFPYGPALAAIAMVLVKPAWQGRGLARALMRYALEVSPPPVAQVLIATPQGFPLYRSLGFKTVGHIRRLIASARALPDAAGRDRVVPLTGRDIEALRALDAEATGVDRGVMLAARLDQGSGCALRDQQGALAGFGLRTVMRGAMIVGPVVAGDAEAAATLVTALGDGHDGPIRLDVPSEQEAFQAQLASLGFTASDEAPVMLLGGEGLPGRREHVFAVANRAFC